MKLAAPLCALALLAGCLAPAEDVDTASAALDSPLMAMLGAIPGAAPLADATIVLPAHVSPEGGLASFWWEIPEGLILTDDDDRYVQFLAAPVLLEGDRAALERWITLGFVVDDGELDPRILAFGAPLTIQVDALLDDANEEIERSLAPFLLTTGGDLRVGDRIGFVVGGVASRDAEFALVLQPLREPWSEDDVVPEDTDAFLDGLGAAAPAVALQPVGTGGMHQLALHIEGGSGFGSMTLTTGPIETTGEITNALAAQRREQTFSTGFEGAGFGISAAGYQAQTSSGSWSARANAHGAMSEGEGRLLSALGPSLTGIPFVAAMGEGEESGETTLTLDSTTGLSGDALFLIELDLDRTLVDLLGLPAKRMEGVTGEATMARGAQDALDMGAFRILVPNVL